MQPMSQLSRFVMVLTALVAANANIAPAEPPHAPHECRWAYGPITIDGIADEPDWARAETITFHRLWNADAPTPRSNTTARLLWDRDYLYFHAEMTDADVVAATSHRDGRLWLGDSIELYLKPDARKPGYYAFHVNPANTQLDMFVPERVSDAHARYAGADTFDYDTDVTVKGTVNRRNDRDTRWTVEGRIAWRSMIRTGARPNINEVWRYTVCRYDYAVGSDKPELSATAPLTRRDFHRHEDYAALRFVGPVVPRPDHARPYGIDKLTPMTTSRVVGSPGPPPPYAVSRAYPKLNIRFPIQVAAIPGSDHLLVIDQRWPYGPTRLVTFPDHPDAKRVTPVLDTPGVRYDVAFHPEFRDNGYVYVGLNRDGRTHIERYTMSLDPPHRIDADSVKPIIDWPSNGHNGGALAFGNDGMLYVTSGDGTSGSDPDLMGQRLDTLLSKVLRIDVDHPSGGRAYGVPEDNPFVDLDGAAPETWAYGLRNPWRIDVDRETGRVWVGNNGQDLWEQVYLIERGANYGWSVTEGSQPFMPNRKRGPHPITPPTVEHSHAEARSLTGGIVYHGNAHPDLRGAYIYGDYSTGKVWAVKRDGERIVWQKELADTTLQITGFGTDTRGELLIADHRGDGGFYRLTPNTDGDDAPFPKRLSDTGLFASVAEHRAAPGVIGYSINAPRWADGATGDRYIAIPAHPDQHGKPVTGRIYMNPLRGWSPPEQTVVIKTLSMQMVEGNPASQRRIETQMLTKQRCEWAAYTYAWNDEQTDAKLVDPRTGAEHTLKVQTAQGTRTVKWRHMSSAECMVCHSRAANYLLGFNTLQLNREHDYGGVSDNQLRTFEHLGLLDVPYAHQLRWLMEHDLRSGRLDDKTIRQRLGEQFKSHGQRRPPHVSRMLTTDPDRLPRLVDPHDPAQPLERRARSYLQANCAGCHIQDGGGNALINLEFTTPLNRTGLLDPPKHLHFDIKKARIVAPGEPERSVLLKRIGTRGPGKMPLIGSREVDPSAIQLMRDWIQHVQQPQDRRK